MAPVLLETERLTRRFGGLTAVDQVDFEVRQGELLAIIGPNGAGKTTLISLLSGELMPNAGRILLDGEDVTFRRTWERSARGLGRSFQITSIFEDLTVLENVALAVQAHRGHSFRFWRFAHADQAIRRTAADCLAAVGLAYRQHVPAGTLAHGEKRQLEIAMVLGTDPKLLLLDEPMAGMGVDEARQMVATLGELKRRSTIILIEHDMDAVFALADRILVLAYGAKIALGAPGQVRDDPAVRAAYLGEDDDA